MHTKREGIANTWKCRFTKQGNYVVVFEWDNLDIMRDTLSKAGSCPPKYYDNAQASAHTGVTAIRFPSGKRCIPKKFGEIHVVKGNYGSRTVAHEIQHIINGYIDAKGWNSMDNNEQIARIAGELSRKFWIGYYKIYE